MCDLVSWVSDGLTLARPSPFEWLQGPVVFAVHDKAAIIFVTVLHVLAEAWVERACVVIQRTRAVHNVDRG